MNFTLYIFSILFLFSSTIYASVPTYTKAKLDSVLNKLDKTIAEGDFFNEKKELHIDYLNKELSKTDDDLERLMIYDELFDEWKNFQLDSALVIAKKQERIAMDLQLPDEIFDADMSIAEVMIITGMYKEAQQKLDKYQGIITNEELLKKLYHLNHTLFVLMSNYSIIPSEKDIYNEMSKQYKDSILSILPRNDINWNLVYLSKLNAEENFDKAILVADLIYDNKESQALIPMMMYSLSDTYGRLGEKEKQMQALAIASIGDLETANKEYLALQELAVMLYEKGDINRAYKYMKKSMEDAIYSKARLRTIEMAKMLPIINSSYDLKMKEEQKQTRLVMIFAIILAIILAASLSYIYKKLKQLTIARQLLKENMAKLNEVNCQLTQTNNKLGQTNSELQESNQLKEEYIGYAFSICSLYIDKLDVFRKKINRQLKGGLVKDCIQQTSSSSFSQEQIKEFYKSFDTVFLNIFPNFISDFNKLLHENEAIYPKDGELLSPELRIYALVRLGITDSIKIATFLHYSPQTVYNYRLKTRNKSFIDRKNFPFVVQTLGREK